MEIKHARPEDANVLVSLIRELAAYEKLSDQCVITPEKMEVALANQTAYGMIVWENSTPIAYAIYYFTFSTFTGLPSLYLEDLYVKPEFRSQGIGTAIFQELFTIANEKGCPRMDFVCLKWNTGSLAYYRTLGAVVLDDWHLVRIHNDAFQKLDEDLI